MRENRLVGLAIHGVLLSLFCAGLLGAALTSLWKENRHNRDLMLWQATEIMRLENELTEIHFKAKEKR